MSVYGDYDGEPRPIARLRAANQGGPDPTTLTLDQRRAGIEQIAAANPPAPDVSYVETSLGGRPAACVEAPGALPDRAIFYTHGGAYVAGSPFTHRAILGELSRHARARVLAVDYRLAPEHPFPAAVEDGLAAYRAFMATHGEGRTAVAGDSAGGGLAVVILTQARDAGLPSPDAGVLFSPWVDLSGGSHSMTSKAKADPIVKPDVVGAMATLYLNGADPRDPRASPLFAVLRGLPPLLIQAGADEVLLDEIVDLERNARQSGVDTTLEVWPEMVHVWHAFLKVLPEAADALRRAGRYLERQWSIAGEADVHRQRSVK
ncbi:MAG TPA: alpha/beta hydrolase [Caulobacteraceae bacterium]